MDNIFANSVTINHKNQVESIEIAYNKKLIYFVMRDHLNKRDSVDIYNTDSKIVTTPLKDIEFSRGALPYVEVDKSRPQFFCFHNNQNMIFYDLKKNNFRKFTPYDHTWIKTTDKILGRPRGNANKVTLYTIDDIREIPFDKPVIDYALHPDLFFESSDGMYHYNAQHNKKQKVADRGAAILSSDMIAYQDKNKTINLYNFKTGKRTQQICSADVKKITLLTNSIIAYTHDEKTFFLWNIAKNTTTQLEFSEQGALEMLSPNLITFLSYEEDAYTQLYDLKNNSLITLEYDNQRLLTNNTSSYVIGLLHIDDNKTIIIIYSAETGRVIKTLKPKKLDNSFFSSCGNYIILCSYLTSHQQIAIYDIKLDKEIFTSELFIKWPKICCYKENYIIFASNESTITIYDYHNDKRIDHSFKEKKITYYNFHDDIFVVSLGNESVIFDLSEKLSHRMDRYQSDFDLKFIY